MYGQIPELLTEKELPFESIQYVRLISLDDGEGKFNEPEGVKQSIRAVIQVEFEKLANAQSTSESLPGDSIDNHDLLQTSPSLTGLQAINLELIIPVFPDLEQMLNLSINRNENEILNIRELEDTFVLSFGRYGHGVGLSQRGAEWMAKQYRWTHQQILKFYYPGSNLTTINTSANPLETLDVRYAATPGPVPTATPRPTLMPVSDTPETGQRIVYVINIDMNSSLNMRMSADYLADIITRLYYGQPLLVMENLENGWLHVKTDTASGYVRAEFTSDKPPN